MEQKDNGIFATYWANWLGIIAIVFAVLLVAVNGTEILKQYVLEPGSAAAQGIPPRCPEYDLDKDSLTIDECHLMVMNVKQQIISSPEWFRGFQTTCSIIGILIAIVSLIVGIALVENRTWAPPAAMVTFSVLLLIDLVGFVAVYNTGPVLRSIYLWHTLIWFVLHLLMTAAAIAGMHDEKLSLT